MNKEIWNPIDSNLEEPLKWDYPRKVFVHLAGDLFAEKVPDEFIDRVFAVIAQSPRHTYQILTSKPERMTAYLTDADWREVHNAMSSDFWGFGDHWPFEGAREKYGGGSHLPWPLPNVRLGTLYAIEEVKT